MKRFILMLTVALLSVNLASAQSEAVTIPVTKIAGVQFFSHSDFSSPGAYYYYIGFQGNGEYNYPWVGMIVYMPTDKGLTEGTYTLASDKMQDVMLVQNDEDYSAAYYGYDPYGFTEAELTITSLGGSQWKFAFTGTDANSVQYQFELSGAVSIEIIDEGEGGGEGDRPQQTDYHYESTTVSTLDVNFTRNDIYTGYVKEYNLISFTLYSEPFDEKGNIYKSELYLFTNQEEVPAVTCPIDFSGKYNTYMASYGVTATGADYPSYLQVRDKADYIIGDWYYVGGDITTGYDAEGKLYMAGSALTYNGSRVNFTYGNVPVGISTVLAPAKSNAARKMLQRQGVIVSDGHRQFDLSGTLR